MTNDAPPSITKLPVLATVAATYRSVRERAAGLALLSRGTAIAAGVAFALSYGVVQVLSGHEDSGFQQAPVGERVAAMTSLSVLIVTIGLFMIIVKWHRMIVRDIPSVATRGRVTRAALLYLARGLLLGAFGFAIALLCGLVPVALARGLAIASDVRWWMTLACIMTGIAAALVVTGRLSMVLPAGAVGDYHVTLSRSWALTRGNSWRIVVGSLLSSGPAFVVNIALNGLIDAMPRMSGSVTSLLIATMFSLVLFVVTAIIQASFLSYAYRFFVPPRG